MLMQINAGPNVVLLELIYLSRFQDQVWVADKGQVLVLLYTAIGLA
jgi:hypothetical protein